MVWCGEFREWVLQQKTAKSWLTLYKVWINIVGLPYIKTCITFDKNLHFVKKKVHKDSTMNSAFSDEKKSFKILHFHVLGL